ncbi:hypothetical protein [Lutibacter citreus]|uniref:hypothetical protein n=1 Tax=Lutibacter citreus TaxID=2138210 RepID=UPI000DBE643B|nr:hypothetical protein [Lutibacter citreus]
MIFQEIVSNKTEELRFSFENLNQFIGHIIWPITVLIILWMYRKHISGVINRLGSFEAGATGISMTFDSKLEETINDFLPSESKVIKSKSAFQIRSGEVKLNSPYHQLLNIRENLYNLIITKSQEFNIVTAGKSSVQLCEILKEKEKISKKNADYFLSLIELTNSGNTTITQPQVNKVKELYNNLKF